MLKIGSHVSISKGLLGAAKEAYSYGATTFMIYTGAPQNTKRSPLENLKIKEGKAFMAAHGISDIVIHAPYIINLASYKEETYNLAKEYLALELERTTAIGSNYLVLHPGSFTDKTYEYGVERIAAALNEVLTPETKPIICLETMAGKGKEIGRSFEELRDIIDRIELKDKIGVCFDTCHVHDSGYDIVENLDEVFAEFDRIIGLDQLVAIHINDTKNPQGAHKDRHANIGDGYLGFNALHYIVHHPKLDNVIKILETPYIDDPAKEGNKIAPYKEEIEKLLK